MSDRKRYEICFEHWKMIHERAYQFLGIIHSNYVDPSVRKNVVCEFPELPACSNQATHAMVVAGMWSLPPGYPVPGSITEESRKKDKKFTAPQTEDEFIELIDCMTDADQKFLYNILHARGHRVEGHFVSAWRKSKRKDGSSV